ncbi:hypothetical protein EYS42_09445 [Aquabacterium lacunae]|uniref:Uncharacterized protein n=1 Tax=Aquabacterium lacunae TaxID=2528630 RepID=A0A4Q9H339_9BURK|nr:hypothetical protein [Aquabacterium lacunae]TBO31447.1 hypothetical protein EYS42_09445 [Aquabacterium lacunae]
MTDDPRCCGSGTCIIDNDGRCWCGQRWDGQRMVGPDRGCATPAPVPTGDTPAEALRAPTHPAPH